MHLFTGIHLFSEIHLINKIHLYRTQNGKTCTISIAIQLLNAKNDEEIKLLRAKNEAQVFVNKVYLSILTFNRSEIVSTAFKNKSAFLGSSKLKTSKNCYKPVKPQKQNKYKSKNKSKTPIFLKIKMQISIKIRKNMRLNNIVC